MLLIHNFEILLSLCQSSVIGDQLPKKTDQVMFCGLSKFQYQVFNFLLSHPNTTRMLASFEPCFCGKKRPAHLCCRKMISDVKPQVVLLQFMQIFLKVANHAALILPDATTSQMQAKYLILVLTSIMLSPI